MSRTQPKVILEIVDKETYKCDQIVEAAGIWAVFYDNQPINLKSQHYLDSEAVPKYKKTNENMKKKKVIKLSENDLYRIVKRVISEQPDKNIKHPSPEEITKGKKTGCYTVNSGDQLMRIAKAFGVTVDDIVQLNAFRSSGEEIYPGQKIKVQNTTKFIGC